MWSEITSQTCPRRVLGASTCNRVAQDWCLFGGYSGEIWVFEPLLEVHILEKKTKNTWSWQTFGQNRKHLSPPRMKSNPFSPAQTCDLEPGVWYTQHNLCRAESGGDGCTSDVITLSFADSVLMSLVTFVRYLCTLSVERHPSLPNRGKAEG